MTRATEIGDAALAKLGLPAAASIHADPVIQRSLGIVAQAVVAMTAGRSLNTFLVREENFPASCSALTALNAGSSEGSQQPATATPDEGQQWLTWFLSLPVVATALISASDARKRAMAAAPAVLRFLAAVAHLQDSTNATAQLAKARAIDLGNLRAQAPPAPVSGDTALLVFAYPDSRKVWHVLLSVQVDCINQDGTRVVTVPAEPVLTTSETEFFDADGAPRGNYSADLLADVTGKPWPETASWSAFIAEIDQRCVAMFGKPLHEFSQAVFGEHTAALRAFVIEDNQSGQAGWSAVFRGLLHGEKPYRAMQFALDGGPVGGPRPTTLAATPPLGLLGVMDSRAAEVDRPRQGFALDPSQRLAAMHATALFSEAGVLAINGPPGTGKTSFLRAVLASGWVIAALEGRDAPPVVFATGATNKAVSNIIEAFGGVAEEGGTGIERRWLEGLPSYGWFYPSRLAAAAYPHLMQLGYEPATRAQLACMGAAGSFGQIQIEDHETTYLERARRHFAVDFVGDNAIFTVLGRLQDELSRHRDALRSKRHEFDAHLDAFTSLYAKRLDLNRELVNLRQQQANLHAKSAEASRVSGVITEAVSALSLFRREVRHAHSLWQRLLVALIPARRVEAAASLAQTTERCATAMRTVGHAWPLKSDELAAAIAALQAEASNQASLHDSAVAQVSVVDKALAAASEQRGRLRDLYARVQRGAGTKWLRMRPEHSAATSARNDDWRDAAVGLFESKLDLEHRVAMFHLAARFWEGRWLLEQHKPKEAIVDPVSQAMMLGVVIVATTHKLLKLGELRGADLLVMDEAGQADPVVAMGCLSLADAALVVGDALQLQPVNTLGEDHIKALAASSGMGAKDIPVCMNPCGGSGIEIAQRCSVVTDGLGVPGITLRYHYRCLAPIIEFCNTAFYRGAMRVMRKGTTGKAKLPAMSWVDVPAGKAQKVGGSWQNVPEIEAIAGWVEREAARLGEAYGAPLDQVFAVVTPLGAQARAAKALLLERLEPVVGREVAARITVGTVHSLQGAERPVVAFSLVQDGPSLFADRDGGHLLNVAVSRAKDAFVLFGDRATFSPAGAGKGKTGGWRSVVRELGAYLGHHGTRLFPRQLVVIEAPGKQHALQEALGSEVAVVATRGTLMQSHLGRDDTLHWEAVAEAGTDNVDALKRAMAPHRGLLNRLFIATDDDLAGELIGMHAAEVADAALGNIPVLRMRFHSLDADELRDAYAAAGDKFDADLLAAALVREYARHLDARAHAAALPGVPFVGAGKRDILDLVDRLERDPHFGVAVTACDSEGGEFHGIVATGPTSLAPDARAAHDTAQQMASALVGQTIQVERSSSVVQHPGLYPASTTMRILGVAADELGLAPWVTQEHLNALYLEGVR